MKREIKFRGISQDKKFIYGDLVQDSENKRYAITPQIGKEHDYNQFEVLEITIGQYTGLKDKNGVEIYDGDIVEFVGGTCDVLTDHYSRHAIGKVLAVKLLKSGFTLIPTPTDYKSETPNTCGFIGNYQLWNNSRSLNVIGNIYENQELLKK